MVIIKKKKKVPVKIAEVSADDYIMATEDVPVVHVEEERRSARDTEFEYVARMGHYRHPPTRIKLMALAAGKTYGVECQKHGTFNIREIRPVKGVELQRRWREIFDYGAIHYFRYSLVRGSRFRLLEMPNDTYVALTHWTGPKYLLKEPLPPRQPRRRRITIRSKHANRARFKIRDS
jgi:hypothetical protein